MSASKAAGWLMTGLFILFVLWVGSLVLGIGLSILNVLLSTVTAIIGGVVSLLLSKNVLTLAAIGLVVYLVINRKSSSHHHGAHY